MKDTDTERYRSIFPLKPHGLMWVKSWLKVDHFFKSFKNSENRQIMPAVNTWFFLEMSFYPNFAIWTWILWYRHISHFYYVSLALADFNSMIFWNVHVQRGMFGLGEQEILLKYSRIHGILLNFQVLCPLTTLTKTMPCRYPKWRAMFSTGKTAVSSLFMGQSNPEGTAPQRLEAKKSCQSVDQPQNTTSQYQFKL